MKLLKKLLIALISLTLIGLVIFNIRLFYQPSFAGKGPNSINVDLIQQLHHLKEKMHAGAATDMQQLFPEGYVFQMALYGLSWIEVAGSLSADDDLYPEATSEIDWATQKLFSEEARRPFQKSLALPYGIFYRGWSNYVLARKLKLITRENRDISELRRFQKNCAGIIQALQMQESPFLESYHHACWPADMVVAMASISIYNDLYPGTYEQDLQNWLAKVETKTDTLGLIPHFVHWPSGDVAAPARGSSQSLILNFLIDIDSAYAKQKFAVYKKHFLDYRIGLPGIREYPFGQSGKGDIDSGPVIWGIGGSASIVGQRTMALYGADATAIGIRNSVETFGLGMTFNHTKNYLFGKLPMADAFIAWSNSVEVNKSSALTTNQRWRTTVQLLSLLVLILGGLGVLFLKKS